MCRRYQTMALTGGRRMTNELEKQFFDTFGIEPRCQNTFINPSKCPFNESRGCYDCVSLNCPQINDRILLGLICILLSNNSPYMFKLGDWDVEKLKDTVLTMCIKLPDFLEWEDTSEYFKHQVRTLFEEG